MRRAPRRRVLWRRPPDRGSRSDGFVFVGFGGFFLVETGRELITRHDGWVFEAVVFLAIGAGCLIAARRQFVLARRWRR